MFCLVHDAWFVEPLDRQFVQVAVGPACEVPTQRQEVLTSKNYLDYQPRELKYEHQTPDARRAR